MSDLYTVEFVGPFLEHHVVSAGGYLVPMVKVHPSKEAKDGISTLVLDNRFLIEAPDEEIKRWIPILANALAIGAGYSCFGENCVQNNPFKTKLSQIGKDL